jgi:hypothetical protein
VRLLVAAGADISATNAKGFDAAALATSAACDPSADPSDEATARFEDILVRLWHHESGGQQAWGRSRSMLLHTISSAPASVPMRRLLALGALLRRCGCDDAATAAETAGAERASVIAARRGWTTLAALLRAPQPPRSCCLCIRRPVEGHPPAEVLLHEAGAVRRPQLSAEPPRLRQATLLAFRSPDEALRSNRRQPADTSLSTAEAEEAELAEAVAEERAVSAIGGRPRERWRTYRWLGNIDCDPSTDDSNETLSMHGLRALRHMLAQMPPPTESLAQAIANCAPNAMGGAYGYGRGAAGPDPGPGPGGQFAGGAQPTAFRQRRRSIVDEGDASLEVIELTPPPGARLLHDVHLQMLEELLGPVAMMQDDCDGGGGSLGDRPWSVYVETSHAAPTPPPTATDGSAIVAEVFSVDTPLLLAFAAQSRTQADLLEALDASGDEFMGDEDEEEDEADASRLKREGPTSSLS